MIAKFKLLCHRSLLRAAVALGLGLITLTAALNRTEAADPATTSLAETNRPATAASASAPDAALASQKIQALGVRDDTRPYEERPYDWLWERREQLTGPLIAGLQSTNLETARQCLRILDGTKPSPALEQALLAVASDPHHQLRPEATLSLCRFAGDPRARALLESMWTNTLVFPDAGRRATLAEAVGHRPEAAALLTSLLATNQESWICVDIIRRLETNGTPAALATLTQAAGDKRWLVAAQARLALAHADPRGHALTAAQTDFLENSRVGGKETGESHHARYAKLAQLPLDEIRPLLRHMLTTDQAGDAALVCGLAHDSDALPEIRRQAQVEQGWRASPFIEAWLLLDPSSQPTDELLAMLGGTANELRQEHILRAVAQAQLPLSRQLAFFRAVRDKLKLRSAVAGSISAAGQPALLAALFSDESDLTALGDYARQTRSAPDAQFEQPLRRAVELVAGTPASALQPLAYQAAAILEAAAAQRLGGLDAAALRLLDTPVPEVAVVAARLAAGGPHREKALSFLHRKLSDPDKYLRAEAAANLQQIPCANDAERRQREQVILALLDQPAADYALRVLTTCAGPRTISQLEPRLDTTNVPAARYAAWVLAQAPDPAAAHKALRRLALHALFCHQIYQAGAGIDFEVAPDLYFHQTTERLNPGTYPDTAPSGLQIPSDLMPPANLDASEQAFLVRDYHNLLLSMRQNAAGNYFMLFAPPMWGRTGDSSYVPFFTSAAREDPELRALYVQGRKVACFPNRQAAAQNLARLTGKPAAYLGLKGETLAHDQTPPQPYPGQDQLVARHVLDRLQAAHLKQPPVSDSDWAHVGYFNNLIAHLTSDDQFGSDLKTALLQEAQRRHIDPDLKAAGCLLWR
jgi:hypothetical protein